MRIGPLEFRPALLPTVATLCMMALTFSAGRWQQGRAEEKQALQARYEQMLGQPPLSLAQPAGDMAALRYRLLFADGEFLADRQIYIDNREHNGLSGYHVITPFALSESKLIVLVNRGWIPRGADYPRAPQVAVPSGQQRVEGVGSEPSSRFLELSPQTVTGQVWQNLTFERVEQQLGLRVLPIILLQQNGQDANLSPVKEQPDFKIDTHRGYAFQWFALTATLLVIYVVVNSKRRTA